MPENGTTWPQIAYCSLFSICCSLKHYRGIEQSQPFYDIADCCQALNNSFEDNMGSEIGMYCKNYTKGGGGESTGCLMILTSQIVVGLES